MKKKLNLTYVGSIDMTGYGVYLDDGYIEQVIHQAMCGEEDGERFMGRVTLTIEPLEDAGLNVEVV